MLSSCSVLHIPLLLNGIWMDYIFKLSMLKPPPVRQIQNDKRPPEILLSQHQSGHCRYSPSNGWFLGSNPCVVKMSSFSNRTFLGKNQSTTLGWIFREICYTVTTLQHLGPALSSKKSSQLPTTSTARRLERRPENKRPWMAMVWDDWFDDLHGFGGCLYADYADKIK